MSKLKLFATCVLCGVMTLLLSCSSHDGEAHQPADEDIAKVYFVYTLDTSVGTPMRTAMRRAAKSNSEVFSEFYDQILTGQLVADDYTLTLTEVNTGTTHEVAGRWSDHDFVTLRTGRYHVQGQSLPPVGTLQERCTFTFDEIIEVKAGDNSVVLHADYSCFLLIFAADQISRLDNFDGNQLQPFHTFSTYRYAFVSSRLYAEDKSDEAYIAGEYKSGTAFRIYTGKLDFQQGKYYVYNSLTGGFDVPPMDEGDTTDGDEGEGGDADDDPNQPYQPFDIQMVSVPAGTFLMGSSADDSDASDDERPQHSVTIAAFRIGKYEVTQRLWNDVMGTNPSYFQGSKVKTESLERPVEMVSQTDALQFIAKLNQLTAGNYRLPTEAEWEFAARGGATSTVPYAGSDDLSAVAWFKDNAASATHPVGTKAPNSLGICDMCGNVWEWTSSPRTADYSDDSATVSNYVVVRGGSFQNAANSCRVAYRNYFSPSARRSYIGFRLAADN